MKFILDRYDMILTFVLGLAVGFCVTVMAKADCLSTFKSGDVVYVQAGVPYNVVIEEPQDIHDFFNQKPEGHELPTARQEVKQANAHFCGEGLESVPEDL